MLRIGMFLNNRYEIIGKIGSGGMSDVYKAKCHKLNRFVAIKVLKSEFSADQNFVSKFRMEAQSAACLSHPNIVNIYDVGEENGIYYIVMELIDGITLKRYIEKKKKLEIRESIEVAMQVARGLEAAHAEHIIHRDIKPQNIMISREGKVKVTDFGIARASSSQTISSNVMGSVHYISPEQARGGYCDERSDIYSLGITLYEMLTGRVPFEGDSTVAVALLHIQGEMVPPREYEPLIPISLEKIILKCTQKKPELRYSSATELIEDLRKSLTMPNGDFVTIASLTSDSPTLAFSTKEMEKIKEGARARAQEEQEAERAYQMDDYDEEDEEDDEGYEDDEDPGDGDDDEEDDDDEDEEEDDDEENDSRFEKIITYISIGVAALIIIVVGAVALRACGVLDFSSSEETEESSDTETTTMIDLIGMTYDEAKEALDELDLELKAVYEENDDVEEGLIFEQSVEEGEEIDKYSTITVTISEGESSITIPTTLAGMTVAEATAALESAGFTNISATTQSENSDTIDEGLVVRTTPSMGSSVTADTEITIVVSAGPSVVTASVPNVVGYTSSRATEILESAGFTVTTTTAESDTVDEGKVISQSPTSGTTAESGSTVTITVSSGSSQVTVPDVRYYTLAQAKQALEAVGLTLDGDPTYEYSSSTEEGLVISQYPTSGTTVSKGTAVSVVIGLGAEPTTAAETTTTAAETTTTAAETTTTAETEESAE